MIRDENGSIIATEPKGLVWCDIGTSVTEDGKFVFRSLTSIMSREMGYHKCFRDVPVDTPSIDRYKEDNG